MQRDEKGRFVSSKAADGKTVFQSGFKGFEKGLICRGKQYAENTVFDENDAVMCKSGMHFCKMPLDVFGYYPPCDNHEYARVDALAPCKTEGDKSCTTKLRINAKISLAGLCSAATNTGFQSAATNTGFQSAATAEGKESFAISTGIQSKVKGALGCFLACAEWKQNDSGEWHPVRFISAKVDGRKIKADTWYTVKDGKFTEVEE